MRAIVQRVMQASVSVGDELVSSIGKGICVLIGISRDDTPKDLEYMVKKILNLRIFDDDQGKRWNKSVMDKEYEVLCVSQFTLYSVLKGNKPDFHNSMGGEQSQQFYEEFLSQIRKSYKPEMIKDGKFGAYMQVNIQNDGPVTITVESPSTEKGQSDTKQKVKQQKKNDNPAKDNQSSSRDGAASLEANTEKLDIS